MKNYLLTRNKKSCAVVNSGEIHRVFWSVLLRGCYFTSLVTKCFSSSTFIIVDFYPSLFITRFILDCYIFISKLLHPGFPGSWMPASVLHSALTTFCCLLLPRLSVDSFTTSAIDFRGCFLPSDVFHLTLVPHILCTHCHNLLLPKLP